VVRYTTNRYNQKINKNGRSEEVEIGGTTTSSNGNVLARTPFVPNYNMFCIF
jgi:hypothetical protein